MVSLADFFDRSGQLQRPPARRLAREFGSFLFHHPAPPDTQDIPPGNGHAVLVLPAFLSGDFATKTLRDFLSRCGYRAFGWGLGINWGPTPRLLDGVRHRLAALRALEGGPVSLIGISLGGLLARDLAHDFPEDVRQVVTLASPFRLPTASTIEPCFYAAAPFYSRSLNLARLSQPLPVPAMSLYTREDGIVAWQSCRDENIGCAVAEVTGSHTTIGRNPETLQLVARRLGEIQLGEIQGASAR